VAADAHVRLSGVVAAGMVGERGGARQAGAIGLGVAAPVDVAWYRYDL
jgi:hypothetical protein